MIEGVLSGLFKIILAFVIATLNVILGPLYYFFELFLPYNFFDFIDSFNSMINSFISYVPFIADLTFLPAFTIHLIVDYIIFKLTLKFAIFSIKLVLKWYDILKG